MAQSIALASAASLQASLLPNNIPTVCVFVAPRHPGASIEIIDRLSYSRTRATSALVARKDTVQTKHLLREVALLRDESQELRFFGEMDEAQPCPGPLTGASANQAPCAKRGLSQNEP